MMSLHDLATSCTRNDPKFHKWYALPQGVLLDDIIVQLLIAGCHKSDDNGFIDFHSSNDEGIIGLDFGDDDPYVVHIPNLAEFLNTLGSKS